MSASVPMISCPVVEGGVIGGRLFRRVLMADVSTPAFVQAAAIASCRRCG
jgi:hypothetical protein